MGQSQEKLSRNAQGIISQGYIKYTLYNIGIIHAGNELINYNNTNKNLSFSTARIIPEGNTILV